MGSKTTFFCDFCEADITGLGHQNVISTEIEVTYDAVADLAKETRARKTVMLCDDCFKPTEQAIFAAIHGHVAENALAEELAAES